MEKIWICANSLGEIKTFNVIIKTKNPCCFKDKDPALNINYKNNNAWMTKEIWEHILLDNRITEQ